MCKEQCHPRNQDWSQGDQIIQGEKGLDNMCHWPNFAWASVGSLQNSFPDAVQHALSVLISM